MSEPLFHTSCPSCGAPVHVHSATAVTVVCSYCNSMLLRQDQSLRDTGRDSALLTDFSPLQIGTVGRFAAQGFTLIGRLQVRYDSGVWNEWYARFDDGTHGWLSEVGDLYVLVREVALDTAAPEFGSIRAGETKIQYGKPFVASDVRDIVLENAAAQGELPFSLPEKFENRVVDFRAENMLLTLDYATNPPAAFLGRLVQLSDLNLQNIKDDQQIRQQAGSLKGLRQAENCPNCGSSLNWVGGATQTVICRSCGSDISVSEGKAKLRAADVMRKAQDVALSLPLGKTGKIRGATYTVIGVIRQDEISSHDAYGMIYGKIQYAVPQGFWFEYLLYSPNKGFLWLVEVPSEGWYVSTTLTEFPRLDRYDKPQGSVKLYAYGGCVSYAAGAFYWHVRAGDVTHYTDYSHGGAKLCAELSRNELAWSKSVPMTQQEMEVFGIKSKQIKSVTAAANGENEEISRGLRYILMAIFTVINIPAWIMMDVDNFFTSAVVSFLVYWFLNGNGSRSDDD